MIKVVIDARYIAAGAITHLNGILTSVRTFNLNLVVICNEKNVDKIKLPIGVKCSVLQSGGLLEKVCWYLVTRKKFIKTLNCDLLIALSGINLSKDLTVVSIFQNMLPFDQIALSKYSFLKRIKWQLFKVLHKISFHRSEIVFCLSDLARRSLLMEGLSESKLVVLGHGVNPQMGPKNSHFKMNTVNKSVRFAYVSNWHEYKLFDFLFEDVFPVDIPIEIDFIGGGNRYYINKLIKKINASRQPNVKYSFLGELAQPDLLAKLANEYDAGIFGSICENSPNIILEKIRAELPILYLSYPSVNELLHDETLKFDLDNVSFKTVLNRFLSFDAVDKKKVIEKNSQILIGKSWTEVSSAFWIHLIGIIR